MFFNLRFTRTLGVILLFVTPAHGDLLYGLDASAESNATANDASFNVFSGSGVDIASPEVVTSWITTTATAGQTIVPNFNNSTGTVTLNGPAETYGVVVTCRVDLTGTHDVTFDRFAFSAQRAGAVSSNVVSDASFSIDGETFTPVLIEEVAVGANNGMNDVGPADTIVDFRTPNGLGGTIGPQQTYVISGLEAAGVLSSGSFYVRFMIGESSQTPGAITFLSDRGDLSTTAMSLIAANTTDLGFDDGFDLVWFGTSSPVVIPTQWTGATSTDWSDVTNWVNEIPSDLQGPAVFSTLSGDNLGTNLDQPLIVPSVIVIEPTGPVSIAGSGPLTLSSGVIDTSLATQDLTISVPLVIDIDSVWSIGSNSTTVIDGIISGTGGFTTMGPDSLLELRADNTYTGFTTLENISGSGFDGIVRIFDPGALGDASTGTSVDAGARLELGEALASPVLEPLFLSGNGGNGNPGGLSNGSTSGDNTWAGPITLSNSARIRNNAAGTTFTLDTPINGTDVDLTIDGTGDTVFTGALSFGTGRLLKAGTGTATLSNGNNYTGNTAVNAGTLVVNGDGIPDASTLVINNGIVQATGIERVAALIIDSVVQAEGTWGATGSGAVNIDDDHFSGINGVVLVGSTAVESAIVITSATGGEGSFIIEWTFSGGAVDIFRSPDLFVWAEIESNTDAGTFTDLTAPAGRAFYVLVPTGESFPSVE